MSEWYTSGTVFYAFTKILRVVVILAIASLSLRFFSVLAERFFTNRVGAGKFLLEEKRAKTLSALIKQIFNYALYFITVIIVLQEFSIDTTSIVAGAGIIGLALGVGAQSLVKDIISGFFIIFEDQYAVGDYIVSGDMAGIVEDIGFRTTRLRDGNGVLHIIPNGAISRISNHTRGHMQAVVNIPVAYEVNIDTVLALLEQACNEVAESMPEVLDKPKVVGIVNLTPGEIILQVVAKTVPLQQVKVEAAYRRIIKRLFDEAKIPSPRSFDSMLRR
ncbi:MAG: MscS Mechanosensitive ion channel [Firmicutes bacterium]|nr:MscS Mechanosensitive ion channel [Bacillota bacterium]